MLAYHYPLPTEQESSLARDSKQSLSPYVQAEKTLSLRIIDADHDIPIELPAGAVSLLMDILGAMASGQSLTLIPENAELTTVQAADLLNVSRPFLIKLLEEEQIPYRKVGKHRRIRFEDVMRYKRAIDQKRQGILDQLAADAQEQGMGYD